MVFNMTMTWILKRQKYHMSTWKSYSNQIYHRSIHFHSFWQNDFVSVSKWGEGFQESLALLSVFIGFKFTKGRGSVSYMDRTRSAWTRIRTYPPWTRLSGCTPQKSGRRTINGWKGRVDGRVNQMTHLSRFQRFLSDWRGSNSRLYRLNLMNYLTAVINVVYRSTPWYIFKYSSQFISRL